MKKKSRLKKILMSIHIIIRNAFIKAADIIKPRNLFEWVLLAIAVPVPLGVVTWVLLKSIRHKRIKTYALIQKEHITNISEGYTEDCLEVA